MIAKVCARRGIIWVIGVKGW